MKNFFKKIVTSIITWEARMVLRTYKPKIVAITGSVGKTSTKDAIYTVLSSVYKTRRSEKSFNSEIGVPLTILGLKNAWSNPFLWLVNIVEGFMFIILPFTYPEWLVLEVGADRPGDIEKISKWLKPDISVVTQFGEVPVHVEYFPSIEDLINEKGFIVKALKDQGTFVYNHDDRHIRNFSDTLIDSSIKTVKKVSYGFKETPDVLASHESVAYGPYEHTDLEFPTGMTFKINHAGSSVPVNVVGGLGKQHLYPVLAAYAVGISLNINPVAISEALGRHEPPKGRMRLIAGNKDTLIIDDSYNSSPVAAHAALSTLRNLECAGRKIAVLGDMMELGQYSIDEHKKVGELASQDADILVTVGIRSRGTAEAALDAGMDENNVLQFESSEEAGKYLDTIIKEGDIILAKGSQSIRMEKVVEEIMRYPERKDELLVRQDAEWKKR